MDIQKELKENIRKFCFDKIEPHMEADDEAGKFRMEFYRELGEMGVVGLTAPEKFGGLNLSVQDFCHALEEVAQVSVSYAVTISVSNMVQMILQNFGSEVQKKKYLPALVSGEEIGSFALSESHSGSDATALKTTAKKVDGGYLLNGTKMWITSGGLSKTYIVMARTGGPGAKGVSAFIVRDGTKGFTYGKAEKKMGWKISPTRELIFENCFIPQDQLIGNEGEGFKISMSTLDKGRTCIGAISVGLAQRALDEAVKYSLEREQFSQKLFDFQGLQFMLSDMATEVMAARLLVQESAKLYDQKTPNPKISSMAKMKASEVAMKVSIDSVQIHGGVGFTTEYPVERLMRDAKGLQIVEGTNQIQKVVIGRQLKKEYAG